MEFKAVVMCFSVLVVVTSPLCKCEKAKKDSTFDYNLEISRDGEEFNEKIEVDTEKETETFHEPKTSFAEEADTIYDFKEGRTMFRVPAAKSCFLYNSTGDLPKPSELIRSLDRAGKNSAHPSSSEILPRVTLRVVGTVDDRSNLSDEMADLCAKQQIYYVYRDTPVDKKLKKRKKRGWGTVAKVVIKVVCGWKCNDVCKNECDGDTCDWVCSSVCSYVCS